MKFIGILFGIMLAFTLASASSYPVVPMAYDALAADTYRVASQQGDVSCAATSSGDWAYADAKLVEIKSNSPIFGGPGDAMSGDYYFSKVLFDPIGLIGPNSSLNGSLNGTYYQSNNTAQWAPRVFYKVPGRDCYNWNMLTYSPTTGYSKMIGIPTANTNNGIQMSGIWFSGYTYPGLTSGIQTIFFSEYAGTLGAGIEAWDTLGTPFIANNPAYSTIRFKQDDYTSTIYYRGIKTSPVFYAYEPVFVTERGSRWLSVGTTSVSAQVATQLATPSFAFGGLTGAISSSKKYIFSTLITDTVDRTLQNRQNTLPEDEYPSLLSDPDTGGAITSPLRAVETGTTVAKNLYRIGGNEYAPFADYTAIDDQAGVSYVEKQAYWAGTTPSGVAYHSGSAYRDIIVNRYSAMATSTKFEGNDFGIPVCTDHQIGDDWTSCTGGSSLTQSHRVKVRFLNDEWVLSEMIAPTAQLASGTAAVNGGQIRLAKETYYGLLTLKQTLASNPLSVQLRNVLPPNSGCQFNQSPAIYNIIQTNGNVVVGQVQACPGTPTYTFTQPGTNNQVKIHTYQTKYSAMPSARWAETAIYSDEIVLKDGFRYNMVSSQDPDKNFRVSLLWKNRDYTGAGSSTVADSLREIVVYQTEFSEKTPKGGAYRFLNNKPAFVVVYEGISPSVVPADMKADVEALPQAEAKQAKAVAQKETAEQ